MLLCRGFIQRVFFLKLELREMQRLRRGGKSLEGTPRKRAEEASEEAEDVTIFICIVLSQTFGCIADQRIFRGSSNSSTKQRENQQKHIHKVKNKVKKGNLSK